MVAWAQRYSQPSASTGHGDLCELVKEAVFLFLFLPITLTLPRQSTMSKAPPLLPFHADVLTEVFFFLDRKSMARCARVNSAFYTLAVPQLYRSITIDLESDTETLVNYMRANREEIMAGTVSMADAPWVLVPTLVELAKPRLGIDLKSLVRHVDLDTHQISTCEGTGNILPSLSGLKSVRLTLHQSSILQDVQYYSLHPWDFAACCVLEEISIPKLVVRNVPLLYARASQNLAPKRALKDTEETVFSLFPDQAVVGTNMKFESASCGLSGILRAMPPSTKRLTLIFWTDPTNAEHGPGSVWKPSPRPLKDGEGSVIETSWVGRFFAQLGRFAKVYHTTFTIVNVGNVDPTAILEDGDEDHSTEHVQEVVEDFVRRSVGEDKVEFRQMRGYMRSREAEGVFDNEEFRLWM